MLWFPRDPATQLSPLTFGFPFFGFGYLWPSTIRKCYMENLKTRQSLSFHLRAAVCSRMTAPAALLCSSGT